MREERKRTNETQTLKGEKEGREREGGLKDMTGYNPARI